MQLKVKYDLACFVMWDHELGLYSDFEFYEACQIEKTLSQQFKEVFII